MFGVHHKTGEAHSGSPGPFCQGSGRIMVSPKNAFNHPPIITKEPKRPQWRADDDLMERAERCGFVSSGRHIPHAPLNQCGTVRPVVPTSRRRQHALRLPAWSASLLALALAAEMPTWYTHIVLRISDCSLEPSDRPFFKPTTRPGSLVHSSYI